MKSVFAAAALIAMGAYANAAEVGLSQSYGTPTGCAIANDASPVPDGEPTAFTTTNVLFEGNSCSLPEVNGASPDWEVKISCSLGDEGEIPGTLKLSEADGKLVAEVLSGDGPEGTFEPCATP